MSAQVTVHRMVTTTTTSALLINVGHLKTFPGILKIFQIILGCVAVGIIGDGIKWMYASSSELLVPELFFLLIATACLITTTLLLLSCIFSIATASIIPKTLFETLYHITASLLYFASALYLLIVVTNRNYRQNYHAALIAASAVGLMNCALYIASSIYSVRTFRRG